jgi:hypothetical protein
MAFKIEQLLLNGSENGNFDWENKHHLLCQSPRTDHGLEAKVKLLEKKSFGTTGLCCR